MSRYRKQDHGGTLFSAIEHQQAVAAKTTCILKLRDLIDWENFGSSSSSHDGMMAQFEFEIVQIAESARLVNHS